MAPRLQSFGSHLLSKIQLCAYGSLTKERSIASYLFVRCLLRFKKKAGWLSTGLYLKSSNVSLIRYYAQSFHKHSPLPYPLSLTRTGIPGCIPSFQFRLIARRDERADKLVKFYLFLFAIYKLILVVKKTDYQYSSIVTDNDWRNLKSLLDRLPEELPDLNIGRWLLQDHSS